MEALVEALPPRLREELGELDLSQRDLDTLAAQLVLIHGPDDRVIPVSHSQRLRDALPAGQARLFKAGGLDHVEMTPGLRDGWGLWRATYHVLALGNTTRRCPKPGCARRADSDAQSAYTAPHHSWPSIHSRQRRRHDTQGVQTHRSGTAGRWITWRADLGVLDRLLEEERLEIDAVSGTSAGAMNAVVLADGLHRGGRDGARNALHRFWKGVSNAARFSPSSAAPGTG